MRSSSLRRARNDLLKTAHSALPPIGSTVLPSRLGAALAFSDGQSSQSPCGAPADAEVAGIRPQAEELASYAFVQPERVPELTSAPRLARVAACLNAVTTGTTVSLESGHPLT